MNKHLKREPLKPTSTDWEYGDCWHYETPGGIEIYLQDKGVAVRIVRLSWGKIRSALKRKDAQ